MGNIMSGHDLIGKVGSKKVYGNYICLLKRQKRATNGYITVLYKIQIQSTSAHCYYYYHFFFRDALYLKL